MWLLGRSSLWYGGVIVYLVLLVVVAVSAGNRGRNGVVWGIWAILFSPPLAGFMLICLGEWKPSEKREVKAAPGFFIECQFDLLTFGVFFDVHAVGAGCMLVCPG